MKRNDLRNNFSEKPSLTRLKLSSRSSDFQSSGLLSIFLVSLMLCLSVGNLHAACAGEGFMGASSGDPVMSMVDITFSPLYSSSTTSGTSGCQNWDFALHLQKEREKFVRIRHQQLLEQSSAGDGPLLGAWSMLMACPREVQPRFNDLMRNHFPESEEVLNSPERMSTYPNRVLGWIRQDPVLSHACQNDDLS